MRAECSEYYKNMAKAELATGREEWHSEKSTGLPYYRARFFSGRLPRPPSTPSKFYGRTMASMEQLQLCRERIYSCEAYPSVQAYNDLVNFMAFLDVRDLSCLLCHFIVNDVPMVGNIFDQLFRRIDNDREEQSFAVSPHVLSLFNRCCDEGGLLLSEQSIESDAEEEKVNPDPMATP